MNHVNLTFGTVQTDVTQSKVITVSREPSEAWSLRRQQQKQWVSEHSAAVWHLGKLGPPEPLPSGNQTWLAGKWTIEISDFPSKTSIQVEDFPASHV